MTDPQALLTYTLLISEIFRESKSTSARTEYLVAYTANQNYIIIIIY